MGRKFIQRIFECARCGKIPEDGEPMWYMGSEIWCKECTEKPEEENNEESNKKGEDGSNSR